MLKENKLKMIIKKRDYAQRVQDVEGIEKTYLMFKAEIKRFKRERFTREMIKRHCPWWQRVYVRVATRIGINVWFISAGDRGNKYYVRINDREYVMNEG